MADQASSNEDVGIASLLVQLGEENAYPYSGADTQGWVEFQETTKESASFGIDPSVGGYCPGNLVLTRFDSWWSFSYSFPHSFCSCLHVVSAPLLQAVAAPTFRCLLTLLLL